MTDDEDDDDRQRVTIPYSRIERRIWTDQKFLALSQPQPCAAWLWFWLLTTPELTTIPGLIPCGRAAMAEMLGWSTEDFDRCFAEIESQGMAIADWKGRLVFLPNAIKINPPTSANVVKSWWRGFLRMRECELLTNAQCVLRKSLAELGQGFVQAFDVAISGPPRKASSKAFGKASAKPSAKTCGNHDSGEGIMKEEGERASAREDGGQTPEPPPPSSLRSLPEAEKDPEVSTLADWESAAIAAGKAPGRCRAADVAFVAEKLTDHELRRATFDAIFAKPKPPAFKFVAEDLARWVDEGRARMATARKETARAEAIGANPDPNIEPVDKRSPGERAAEFRERAKAAHTRGWHGVAKHLEDAAAALESAPDPPRTELVRAS